MCPEGLVMKVAWIGRWILLTTDDSMDALGGPLM